MSSGPTLSIIARGALATAWGATGLLSGFFLVAVQAETAQRRFAITPPVVELEAPIAYRCDGGSQLLVRYGRLSDGSLSFARLLLPGGRIATLPQLVSASGSRYSDDQQWQWWSKGSGGFLEERNGGGAWQKHFRRCQR